MKFKGLKILEGFIMKNIKRTLSIILTLALLISSVGLGLGTEKIKSEVPAAKTLSTATPSFAVNFYVPEVIYLTPHATSATVFKHYVDVNDSGTVNATTSNTSTTVNNTQNSTGGNLYFYAANATQVKIQCTGASITGTTPAMNTFAGGTTINTTVTGGTMSTGLAPGGVSYLTWTATYTVNGENKSATAYTACYAPLVQPIGSGIRYYNNGGTMKHDNQSVAWISGENGLAAGNRTANESGTALCPLLSLVSTSGSATAFFNGTSGGEHAK